MTLPLVARSARALSLVSLALGVTAAAATAVTGCCGKAVGDAPAPCESKKPPPIATSLRVQLSRVDFGELDSAGAGTSRGWRTLGYDLDGVCTTSTAGFLCKRAENAPAANQDDGDDGVDNSFGKSILPLFISLYGKPSAQWSSGSYLQLEADGTGVLYLIDQKGMLLRAPLRDARVEPTGENAGILAAVIPVTQVLVTLRDDLSVTSTQLCGGSTLDSFAETVRRAADMPAVGETNSQIDCDGISLGMRFEGTPVGSLPTPPPSPCAPPDGGTGSDDGGDSGATDR